MKSYKIIPILLVIILGLVGAITAIRAATGNTGRTIIYGEGIASGSAVSGGAISGSSVNLAENAVTVKGVIRSIDTEHRQVGIYITDEMAEKTFQYDTITTVTTLHGQPTVMESLPMGDVVTATVMSDTDSLLLSVTEDADAWDYKNVRNLDVDKEQSIITIGSREYKYDSGISILSGTKQIEFSDIDFTHDILDVKGIDENVLSINVTTGHGVLDFKNYDDFLGGDISVGYDVFDTIADDMKYTLREGIYKVKMTNGGLSVNKVVKIERDRTTTLDLSKYKSDMEKKSRIRFNIAPYTATLYIDGSENDFTYPLTLEYGEYIIKVTCDGYEDYETILQVKKPKQEINISLASTEEAATGTSISDSSSGTSDSSDSTTGESAGDTLGTGENNYTVNNGNTGTTTENKSTDNSGNSNDSESTENTGDTGTNTSKANTGTGTTDASDGTSKTAVSDSEAATIPVRTDENSKISFRNPEGATVYFDGTEVGTVPCETTKVTGEHVIMLSKEGYTSQNYTVDIEDDGQDTIFSFPELTK
ncbi:MAG: PEGA domain-containing protein [Catonella sp.]|nr:PEGA domain-containing protein [Catonella sp.]MDY6356709.1 PEGA domain-containing protein [Catonella sp.]